MGQSQVVSTGAKHKDSLRSKKHQVSHRVHGRRTRYAHTPSTTSWRLGFKLAYRIEPASRPGSPLSSPGPTRLPQRCTPCLCLLLLVHLHEDSPHLHLCLAEDHAEPEGTRQETQPKEARLQRWWRLLTSMNFPAQQSRQAFSSKVRSLLPSPSMLALHFS